MTHAVIFDLDGTLLNTLGDLTAAVNHGLAAQGLPAHTEAEVRTYVGDGVKELIARACPSDATDETRAAVLAAYLPYYAAHNADLTVPYDGVMDLLTTLRDAGVRCAAVTWGFQDRDRLAAQQPAALVDTAAALQAVLLRE